MTYESARNQSKANINRQFSCCLAQFSSNTFFVVHLFVFDLNLVVVSRRAFRAVSNTVDVRIQPRSFGLTDHLLIGTAIVGSAAFVDLATSYAMTMVTDDPKYINKWATRASIWGAVTSVMICEAAVSTAASCQWITGVPKKHMSY